MTRVAPLFVGMLMLVPALSIAQTVPVPPPPPPAAVPPVPPAAPAPPAPPSHAVYVDRLAIDEARHAADMVRIDTDMIREQTRVAVDQARIASSDAMNSVRMSLADMQNNSFMTYSGQSNESSSYSNAKQLMFDHKYEEAISRFDRVIMLKSTHADGSLYYKAFCQAKLGQSTDAGATLAELKKSYPQSPYLKDSRALEADMKKLGPSEVDDEDLKILALQSLQYQSPDQAVPLLEGVLTKSTNSLKIKRQALFVLAQIDAPRARQTLLSYAKGTGNPDLQIRAIELLGQRGQKTTSAELIEIYNSTADYDVRSSVIRAFQYAGAKSPLMSIAQSGNLSGQNMATAVTAQDIALRSRAINSLTDLASPQELWPLYQKEENKDLRSQWVSVFSSMGAVDQLLQIVKTEKDPTVRNKAVRALGNVKSEKTGPALTEVYSTGDKDTKTAVIAALGNQNNAEGLIAVFDKETDLGLRKEVVNRLFDMSKNSKVALDFLTKLINK